MAEETQRRDGKKNPGARVISFLAGYHLACVCLLLLGLLTWLGTLEQADHTLLATTKKYFNYETVFLFPEFNGKVVPIPLPNGFWVGLIFFINLLLGPILKVRRGIKQVGILISHCGMLLLLVGAFVTQVKSQRGNMTIEEGEVSDVAQHYTEHVIEVSETDGKEITRVHLIANKYLKGLKPDDRRLFRMKSLPFDVEVKGYQVNSEPLPVETFDQKGLAGVEFVDGFTLDGREPDKKSAERDMAGCYVNILDKEGNRIERVLLASACVHPATFEVGAKIFTITIRKSLWKMPFEIQLDKFTHEFHPGTRRPRVFRSDITRIEEDGQTEKVIRMNNPMRYKGYTFFQASWGPQDPTATRFYSVFEVVKNPADHWPLVSLIITGFGMLIHFVLMLVLFIIKQMEKNVGDKRDRTAVV
ncbi:MAG: cytochrome c biogenesis protein ResB [Roseibacillus sp.]|nr:cytochrome c biogenesis protein ResB [Roseibacillus sp.]